MSAGRRFVIALLIAGLALVLPNRCVGQWGVRAAVSQVTDSVTRAELEQVYSGWSWRLLWLGPTGPLARTDTLLAWLDHAADDGLAPGDYAIAILRAALRSAGDSGAAEADVLLSEAFLRLGHDLAVGRISPPLVDSLWDGVPPSPNFVAALNLAIERDDVGGALATLRPRDPRYAALRRALVGYRAIAARGGWPTVSEGADLQLGDQGPRVAALRGRLAQTESLEDPADSTVFDSGMEEGLRRFQARMGLTPDGVVGPATRDALNVPVEHRIATMEMNLERWRWAPRLLGTRYLIVNIPAYALELHDSGATVLGLRAIVGRRDRPTPITNAWMDGITFRPQWNVPRAIALQEIVPLERARPGYLRREGFRVLRAGSGAPVDPDSINWSAVDSQAFPFRLVQDPGPDNPLGRLRFDVRDPFNVAIHDTPARSLFADRVRLFSHGCVRVDSAAVLAARLLPDWSPGDVREAQHAESGRTVPLPRRLRVLLTYQTAWVDADGAVAFRDDVYGWDDELAAALFRIQEVSLITPPTGRLP